LREGRPFSPATERDAAGDDSAKRYAHRLGRADGVTYIIGDDAPHGDTSTNR
jgi:hypothetical protein